MAINGIGQQTRITPDNLKKIDKLTYPGYIGPTLKARVNFLLSYVLDKKDCRSPSKHRNRK